MKEAMKALTEEKVVYHGELDQFIKFHNDNHESRIDSVVNLRVQSWENQQKSSTFLGGCFSVW